MPEVERLVFFGTPRLALPTLQALCRVGRGPRLVVTQPARRAGRGQHLHQPPIAEWALGQELPIEQPESVRDPEFLARLRALAPDLAIVVAFGQIFPQRLLDIPTMGCINLHASLLPRYRGAAPVQAAIAAGDRVSGVTTISMERGLDSGPILQAEEVVIGFRETAGELATRLAEAGAGVVLETIASLVRGELEPQVQDEEAATYAPTLRREDGHVDWTARAIEIERRLRALTPWPGSFTYFAGESIKLLKAELSDHQVANSPTPGTFLGIRSESILVACGDSSVLAVSSLQRPGKRPVGGRDLANGLRLGPGARFG